LVIKSQTLEKAYEQFAAKITVPDQPDRLDQSRPYCIAFLVHPGKDTYDYRFLTLQDGNKRSNLKDVQLIVPETEKDDFLLAVVALSQRDFDASSRFPNEKPLEFQLSR
jgi:hypothetical protein